MKQKFKPLSWKVKNFDCNKQAVIDYNILEYREDQIKKFKKKSATKEEFTEKLRREFQYIYWSRSEYELIVSTDENDRIWLTPWVGCREPEKVKIDVTDDKNFDWRSFAEVHIKKQIYDNRAKVDIFDQLMFAGQFEKLVDYLWYTRLKYERKNEKFDR